MGVEAQVVKLLETLVSYNTVNDPERGVRPSRDIVDFVADWLGKRGIDTEIVESNGYYSVFGILGREPPCVGLLAHLDTVPVAPERWSYDPFKLTVVSDRAYGRGALDDKSNVASILLALERLRGSEGGCGVVFAFTSDEEIGGANGALVVAQRLRDSGLLPRYLINGDGMGMVPIVRRRKGFSAEVLVRPRRSSVRGVVRTVRFTAHYPVSQHAHAAYFVSGADSHPLIAASVFVRESGALVRSVGGRFMKSNVVPPEVEVEYVVPDPSGTEVEVDEGLTELMRALLPIVKAPVRTRAFSEYGVSATPNVYTYDHAQGYHRLVVDVRAMALREDVEGALREVVGECLPEADLRVRTDAGGYMYTPPTSRVVEALAASLREVGVSPRFAEGAGASDSRYFVPLGVEAVDIGPRGGNMHGDDEYVELGSLALMPMVYYRTVERLARGT